MRSRIRTRGREPPRATLINTMAQFTRHPSAPAPTAPPREATGRIALRAYAVLLVFCAFAHTALWNLLGISSMIILAALSLATIAIWVPLIVRAARTRSHPEADERVQRLQVAPLAWRRFPWATLGYVALALASVAWSVWPTATLATWALLAGTTLQGLFLAHVLTWGELLRTIDLALKWVLGLSLVFELWAATILRHPLLPNFVEAPDEVDPHLYWTRGVLFDLDQRIQGIVGNANVLSIVCVIAFIVIGARLAARPRTGGLQVAWLVLVAALYLRAGSATGYVALAVVAAVLAAVLLMRRAQTPGARTRLYATFTGIAVVGAAIVLIAWDRFAALLGRSDGLTGRDEIWASVWDRAIRHPVFGSGFSTPWVPWEPAFDQWIVDHGLTVFHAHNMWLDVFLQLGAVGVVVIAVVFGALTWRSWFFAVDRPRWDIVADRPYSHLTLVAPLICAALLTQGLTESGPLMLWGWLLVVTLAFRIKLAPIVGVGAAESPRGLPAYATPQALGDALSTTLEPPRRRPLTDDRATTAPKVSVSRRLSEQTRGR